MGGLAFLPSLEHTWYQIHTGMSVNFAQGCVRYRMPIRNANTERQPSCFRKNIRLRAFRKMWCPTLAPLRCVAQRKRALRNDRTPAACLAAPLRNIECQYRTTAMVFSVNIWSRAFRKMTCPNLERRRTIAPLLRELNARTPYGSMPMGTPRVMHAQYNAYTWCVFFRLPLVVFSLLFLSSSCYGGPQ